MDEQELFPNQNQSIGKARKGENTELLGKVSDVAKRLRILDDRYLTIRKKTQLTDQNMLEINKRFNSEIKAINIDIDELKISLRDMTEKLDQLISETGNLAKKNELVTLSKYVDMWRPMNFVTKEQLDRELQK
jgi:hypothetical protein